MTSSKIYHSPTYPPPQAHTLTHTAILVFPVLSLQYGLYSCVHSCVYCVEWENSFEFCPKVDRHIIRKARASATVFSFTFHLHLQQYLPPCPHSVATFIETSAMFLYKPFQSGTNTILHFMENIAMFLYITFKLVQLKCL